MANIQETMYKKNLKTRLTKQQAKEKRKQEKRAKKKNKTVIKQDKSSNLENTENRVENKNKETDDNKVVFNKESKMVFNKIDFSEVESKKTLSRKRKDHENDPKVLLESLKKSKLELSELEKSGETLKAKKIKEKQMWSSALKRSEGIKVKDDELLLKRTIRKQKETKNRLKKKWDMRVQATEKKKEDRQKKRQENIAAKKKEKKKRKIKKSIKKGRVVL